MKAQLQQTAHRTSRMSNGFRDKLHYRHCHFYMYDYRRIIHKKPEKTGLRVPRIVLEGKAPSHRRFASFETRHLPSPSHLPPPSSDVPSYLTYKFHRQKATSCHFVLFLFSISNLQLATSSVTTRQHHSQPIIEPSLLHCQLTSSVTTGQHL